ncbi:MAG: hypothetical protein AB1744_12990, partial [Candidatus Zixiibacteriota bacterium]
MRFNKLVLSVGVILLAGLLVLAVGCGKDKEKSTEPADFNDPNFVAVQGEIERFVDSTLDFFTSGVSNIQGLATDTIVDPILYSPTPIDTVTDSVSASYESGWHVVYIGLNRENFASVLRDSIRFLNDGVPQQNPSGLDQLLYKHYWAYNMTDTTVTHFSFTGNNDFNFTGLDTDEATIAGAHDMSVHWKQVTADSTVWRDYDIDATVTNVHIRKTPVGWINQCPVSGAVSGAVQMIYQKDTDAPDTTNWTVNVVFDNGSAWFSVVSG